MKQFIFLTEEGSTFQPNSSSLEPDIDNLQVIGFAEGFDAHNAFESMLSENSFLKETTFDRVFALKLAENLNEMYSNKFSIQLF